MTVRALGAELTVADDVVSTDVQVQALVPTGAALLCVVMYTSLWLDDM